MTRTVAILIAAVVSAAAASNTVYAYVGPGAGLSLLGALWGLLLAIGAALLFVVLWPIRRAIKNRRKTPETDERHATVEDHPESQNR